MLAGRAISPLLESSFAGYPVVTVTGPRQSGKTTLCRATFPQLPYFNLEQPDLRVSVAGDPMRFLKRIGDAALIDEVQRVPELFSYLQVHVDELRKNGMFVLTGSEQFRLSESISQSLAGRTAVLRLLPFTIEEAETIHPSMTIDELLFNGFYPRIYDQQLQPSRALGDYFETYVERDVRNLGGVRDLSTFHRFVQLCASRVGQLLNLISLGSDAGVSHTTARSWISVLEASYVAFVVPPLHANISKRLIKTPKLYFHDVGLAAWLLGIETVGQLATHPLRGALFENLVISEVLKYRYNSGRRGNLHFYRDSAGLEVDLVYPLGGRFVPIEIKAGVTVTSAQTVALEKFARLFPDESLDAILVHGGDEKIVRGAIMAIPVRALPQRLRALEEAHS